MPGTTRPPGFIDITASSGLAALLLLFLANVTLPTSSVS